MEFAIRYGIYKDYIEMLSKEKVRFTKGEYNSEDKTIVLNFEKTNELNALYKLTNDIVFASIILNNLDFYYGEVDQTQYELVLKALRHFYILKKENYKNQAKKIFIEGLRRGQTLDVGMIMYTIEFDSKEEKKKLKDLAKKLRKEDKLSANNNI